MFFHLVVKHRTLQLNGYIIGMGRYSTALNKIKEQYYISPISSSYAQRCSLTYTRVHSPTMESAMLPFPPEFLFFGLTLVGVAAFHHHTLRVALIGLAVIVSYKLLMTDFSLHEHLIHESSTLLNLLGLLVGFELLADHFRQSKLPSLLPRWLPDDWKGAFVLLVMVFLISTFLDNIAAAMIGGTIAAVVFQKKVHIGYLAAIVAASNAGGAGSVVGDTTTTMMWIDGVDPGDVAHAFMASFIALALFGVPASLLQDKHHRILRDPTGEIHVDWHRLGVVGLILAGAILANIWLELPAVGVWAALIIGSLFRQPDWGKIPHATINASFLLALVLCASMMPVKELPLPSWETSFGLGFVSAVFDNIPLTALALKQGGYDWGHLAFHVGFGGSMVWFGSSAGVALANDFSEAKDAIKWVRHGWFIPIAYVIASVAMYLILGWHPHAPHN